LTEQADPYLREKGKVRLGDINRRKEKEAWSQLKVKHPLILASPPEEGRSEFKGTGRACPLHQEKVNSGWAI
jgi:hypothetical protein